MSTKTLKIPNGSTLYYRGDPLEKGPQPAVFYFSISGKESLELGPFNQPAAFLEGKGIRVFSLDLPFHGEGQAKEKAMEAWALSFAKGDNLVKPFIESVSTAIDTLFELQALTEGKVVAAGLSRGAFIATHLAAADSRISTVLGYAPLTNLTTAQTFNHLNDNTLVQSLGIDKLIDKLQGIAVRYYIGNRDILVSTASCFDCIRQLADAKFASGEREPQAELIISPSVGHKGHGTLPHIFRSGTDWLEDKLLNHKEVS